MKRRDLSPVFPASVSPQRRGIYLVNAKENPGATIKAIWQKNHWYRINGDSRRVRGHRLDVISWCGIRLSARQLERAQIRRAQEAMETGSPAAALALARHAAATGRAAKAIRRYMAAQMLGARLTEADMDDQAIIWATMTEKRREAERVKVGERLKTMPRPHAVPV
jgi:hypothetical protein